MKSQRLIVTLFGLTATMSAFGSMANTAGNAWDQTVASGTLDQSVQVLNDDGSYGSGGLFGKSTTTVGDVDYINLCFATADHVLNGSSFSSVKFGNGAELTRGASSLYMQKLGGWDNNQDLAFFGLSFRLDALQNPFQGGTYASFLDSLTTLNVQAYDYSVVDNAKVTSYGYGRSARYLVNGNGDRIGFQWDSNLGGAGASGIHRNVNHTTLSFNTYSEGPYDYEAIKWETSDQAGEGQINSGDSGGVISLSSDNHAWVGVNTYAVGDPYRSMGVDYEAFLYGSEGGGLGFTANDVDWLNTSCMEFEAVPEPASMVILGFGAILALRRKRR
ncbi:MAG: PEP-CTERM sorting domain-containing protein [Fimbriimonadaceae bacterium]